MESCGTAAQSVRTERHVGNVEVARAWQIAIDHGALGNQAHSGEYAQPASVPAGEWDGSALLVWPISRKGAAGNLPVSRSAPNVHHVVRSTAKVDDASRACLHGIGPLSR
jgi:hypothetical protein